METDQFDKIVGRERFAIGRFLLVSQNPENIKKPGVLQSADLFLAPLIELWRDVELATKYRWKCTSFLRNSPSHEKGHALDIAPDFDVKTEPLYAVSRGSDPVLYKREPLIRALQSLANIDYSPDGSFTMGIFIEPDHLHLQVLQPRSGQRFPTSVIKWRIAKPIYSDTYARMTLPMFK
jgi:hypothetical protein